MKKINLIIIILIFLSWLLYGLRQPAKLEVDFLDIGQGDSTLIRTPGGINILVDTGPDDKVLYELSQSLPWWDHYIDYVIISHWHADHFVGLIDLQKKYRIGHILVNGNQPDQMLYRLWESGAEENNIDVIKVSPGQKFELDEQTYWQVLYADDQADGDFNTNSIVIKFTYQQIDLLLTGDLPAEQEQLLADSDFDLGAEILKVGHHGSRYSSSRSFLEKIRPQICIIESGQDNKFGHPHQETLERLTSVDCQVHNTQFEGRIELFSDGVSWWTS